MFIQLFFPFVVHWEILRSGFNNTLDVALEADTYGEEWALEMRSNETMLLKTPRGSTRVIGLKTTDDPADLAAFDTLVVNEQELARLLGIQDENLTPWGRDIMISFSSLGPEEQNFVFKVNPKYFVSVNMRFTL